MKFYEKFLYLRMCYNQCWNYVQIPIDLFQKFLLVSVFLKVKGMENTVLVIVGFAILLAGNLLLGHLAIKNSLPNRDLSFNNQFNNELMEIHEKTVKGVKR